MVKTMDYVLSSYVEADHCKSNSMLEIWKLSCFTGQKSFLDVQQQCNGLITNIVDYVCYISLYHKRAYSSSTLMPATSHIVSYHY
jgi:hypothetical protein